MLIVSELDCEHNQWNREAGKLPTLSSSDNSSSFQCWTQKWDINLYNVFSCHTGTHPVKKTRNQKILGRRWHAYQGKIILSHHQILTQDRYWFTKGTQKKSWGKTKEKKGWGQSWRVQQEQTMQTCKNLLWKSRSVWRKAKGLFMGWQWGQSSQRTSINRGQPAGILRDLILILAATSPGLDINPFSLALFWSTKWLSHSEMCPFQSMPDCWGCQEAAGCHRSSNRSLCTFLKFCALEGR